MRKRARHVALGVLASGALGALMSVGQASASTLVVDGGVIQHWEMPAGLDMVVPGTIAPESSSVPVPGAPPAAKRADEDQGTEDQSQEAPAQPGEEQPGEGQPGEDQPGDDQPGDDQPGDDKPGEDPPHEAGNDMETGDGQSP